MDTFQLPLSDPPIKGFLRWTYLLSITNLHEKTIPWYYSNFVQLYCNRYFLEEKVEFHFDFYRGNNGQELYFNNRFLVTTVCNFEILSFLDDNNIIAYFVDRIKGGYYPVVFIDESLIPHSPFFNGSPFPHHILLNGYNWTDKTFDVAMFGKKMLYENYKITFDEFKNAYLTMKKIIEDTGQREMDFGTFFYKFNDQFEYAFDKIAVMNEIKDYLRSDTNLNRINFNTQNFAFGLEVYDYLKKYYEAWLKFDPSMVQRGVVRHLHILWEHKKVMADRIKYYNSVGIILPDDFLLKGFEDLTSRAEIMRNSLLRFFRKATDGTFQKIIEELDEMKVKEQILMERLLSRLDN